MWDISSLLTTLQTQKRREVYLAVVGPSTFSLLRNLVSPAKPGEKTFEELVALLQEHYNPKPSETVQRAKFQRAKFHILV